MHRHLFCMMVSGAAILAAPLPVWAQVATSDPAASALVRIEERLTAMDQQFRVLTDKIEQLQYAQTQDKAAQTEQLGAVQRKISDLELRVNTLGVSTQAAPAVPAQSPAPVENKAAEIVTPTPAPAPEAPAAAPAPADPNAPLTTAPTVQPLGTVVPDGQGQPGTPEGDYESAFQMLQDGNQAGAETAFRTFIESHPAHRLAGNAQYWLGETFFARGQFKEAAKTFAEGYQKYRGAAKAADNLVKLGLSLEALDNKDDACVTYLQFNKEFATGAASSLTARVTERRNALACPES